MYLLQHNKVSQTFCLVISGVKRLINFAETRQNVNIDEWLDVWGFLLNSARTLEALPLWLQYFPKILFQVINKSGQLTI